MYYFYCENISPKRPLPYPPPPLLGLTRLTLYLLMKVTAATEERNNNEKADRSIIYFISF